MKLQDELDKAVNNIEGEISDLEAFNDWINEAEEKWAQRSEPEQDAFKKAARPIRQRINNDTSVGELLKIHGELASAYEKPVLDALQDEVREFADVIEVKLTKEDEEQIDNRLADQFENKLIEARRTYSDLRDRIEGESDIVQETLRKSIEENKSLLLRPEEIQSTLETLISRRVDLESISEFANNQDWFPDPVLPLEARGEFYNQDLDVEEILDKINKISIQIDEIPGLGFQLNKIAREVTEIKIEEDEESLEKIFSEIQTQLQDITTHSELLQTVDEIESEVDYDSSALDRLESVLHNIQSEDYSTFDDVEQDVFSLQTALERWQKELKDKWLERSTILERYSEAFGFDLTDELETSLKENYPVESDPVLAYNLLIKAENWIESKEDDLREEFEYSKSIDLLRNLVDRGSVRFEEYDAKFVEEVDGVIPLRIYIDEE